MTKDSGLLISITVLGWLGKRTAFFGPRKASLSKLFRDGAQGSLEGLTWT